MPNQRKYFIFIVTLAIPLAGFSPFTETQSVCPECPRPTKDTVVLKSGSRIWCNVLAENDDYYVLERFGELRAAFKSEVESVNWGPKRSSADLQLGDQILLKNDVLYFGSILSEDPGNFFTIQSQYNKQIPSVNMIRSVHKGGKPYAFQSTLPNAPKVSSTPNKPPPKKAPPQGSKKK
jgi:hypothetical protein